MRMWVGDLELEVRPGVAARDIVAFASAHGIELPARPFCGPVALDQRHEAGKSPLVAHARLTAVRGPDARPRPGIHLAVVGGPDAGAVATLEDGLVIGRAPDAGLRLRDATVSASHARIDAGRLRELGSRNGVLVDGKRLRWRRRLSPGDVVRIGEATIVVADPGAEREPESPRRQGLGIASSGIAALSMGAFAIATGHWPLALVAIAIPVTTLAAHVARRPRENVGPALDVTGTLDLPVLPPGPIAVRGPRGLVRAVTLATGRPSASARHAEPWMRVLPPAEHDVTWLEHGEEAPSWAEVRIAPDSGRIVVSGHGTTLTAPLPLVTEANAEAAARRIAARATRGAIPRSVRWGELPPPSGKGPSVRLGIGEGGAVELDLVADGPHILVAGTTGSGKSEALRTIIASLAHDLSPSDVNFALIDFKGGAGLGSCSNLPHVASVLTDLEPHLARRALHALTAELAQRKRDAARAGVAAFEEWDRGRPPQLVVVVDEFQEIAATERDFLPELARIAAQGRSLGIHLVLATQRPAGAVGAEVRANIGTTLALRTASEAESRDLIGTGSAALLPVDVPGRALLLRGTAVEELQVALPLADPPPPIRLATERPHAVRQLVDAARDRHVGHAAPLWLPELPDLIAPVENATGYMLGVADIPALRARAPLEWDPAAGPLVITGPPRSGRSSALAAVAALAKRLGLRPIAVPREPRGAARTIALARDVPDAILLVDDCARTLAASATADVDAPELLSQAILSLPTVLVVPPGWASHRLTAHVGLRVVMTGLADEDDAAWGVPRELRGLAAAPGRARVVDAAGWREAQLALPGEAHVEPLVQALPIEVRGPLTRTAIGIGGDLAAPLEVPQGPCAVIGPVGPEREAIARRLAIASGTDVLAAESGLALAMPGTPACRTVVCVRPTARTLREVMRETPHGLLEPATLPFRAVAIVDGVASAVQVLPA